MVEFTEEVVQTEDGTDLLHLVFTEPDFRVIISNIALLEEPDEGKNVNVNYHVEHKLTEYEAELLDEAILEVLDRWVKD